MNVSKVEQFCDDGEGELNRYNVYKITADSITSIMNAYWQKDEREFQEKKHDDRFERYWARIQKRAQCLAGEPELAQAYDVFLQFNAISHEGSVYVIDWAFAGIMPYSLDIARMIAHGTEERTTFPFYMTDAQRKLYVEKVYKKLKEKPDWERYLEDIRLSLLNEYVEFIEYELHHPEEERDKVFAYYYSHAKMLAVGISRMNGGKRGKDGIQTMY